MLPVGYIYIYIYIIYIYIYKWMKFTITLNFKSPRCWRKKLTNTNAIFIVHVCMLWRTPLLLLPTSSFSLTSKSRYHPHNTSIMILYCFTSYPWYFCFNSQQSSPYFVVFSSSWAAHLKRDYLLWLVVDNAHIYSVGSNFLELRKEKDISECLCIDCLIDWLWFQWRVPEWHWLYKAEVLQNLEEKYLQGCVMPGNVLVLCKGGATSQDMGNTFRGLIT